MTLEAIAAIATIVSGIIAVVASMKYEFHKVLTGTAAALAIVVCIALLANNSTLSFFNSEAMIKPPDISKVVYDTQTLTLLLYSPPDGIKWAMRLPGSTSGAFIDSPFLVPETVDADAIDVYFQNWDGQTSSSFSVKYATHR